MRISENMTKLGKKIAKSGEIIAKGGEIISKGEEAVAKSRKAVANQRETIAKMETIVKILDPIAMYGETKENVEETVVIYSEKHLSQELIDTDQNQSIVQKVEEIPSDKTENIDNKAKEEFLESCRDFYGAYELLYQIRTFDINNNLQLKFLLKWEKLIKINKLDALNAVWEKTIMNCSGNETKSLINFSPNDPKLKKIASKWLMKLEEWGVERKEEEEFIIEVKSTLYYDIDDIYEFGEKAQVIEKCWIVSRDSQGNKLKEPITVEKGLARLLKS